MLVVVQVPRNRIKTARYDFNYASKVSDLIEHVLSLSPQTRNLKPYYNQEPAGWDSFQNDAAGRITFENCITKLPQDGKIQAVLVVLTVQNIQLSKQSLLL